MIGLRNTVGRLLPRGKFRRGVTVLVGGTMVGQGLLVAASPLLTRLFTPEDFGVLAIFASLLGLLSVVASLRYDLAIPLPRSTRLAASLFAVALVCVIVTSGLVTCVLLLGGKFLLARFGIPQAGYMLWMLPLGLVSAGVYQVLRAWALRVSAFSVIARTEVSQRISQVAIQVGLGFLLSSPLGLLLGDLAGRAQGAITLGRAEWREVRGALREVSVRRMVLAARRYGDFPRFSSSSGLLNAAGYHLPALLLAGLYGVHVAGWFALSQRVIGLPMRMVGQAAAQAYFGEAARLRREQPTLLPQLFSRVVRNLLLWGAIPILALGLAGPLIFRTVFGAAWYEAGFYVLLLTPVIIAQFVVSPISQTTAILERQRAQLLADSLRTAIVVLALLVPSHLGWSHVAAIGSYSLGMLLTYVGSFVLYRHLIARLPPVTAAAGARA